jgi:hypothetical protein
MKKLISNTGGLQTFLEIKPVEAIPGMTYLRITTTFEGAKDTSDERVKFDVCLDQSDFDNLRAALNDYSL